MNRSVLSKLLLGTFLLTAPVAQAQFVVFDPNNFSQNILTAARSLEQINNQVTSLQHESQMLTNEARISPVSHTHPCSSCRLPCNPPSS